MPIVPLRELGKLGVITDVDPFDLPINSFSFAKNVRFEDNKVERGSVFRHLGDLAHAPRHLVSYNDSQNVARSLVVSDSGSVYDYVTSAGTMVDKSPLGWSPALAPEAPVTTCFLQNVLYINRPDHAPWYRPRNSAASFSVLPTDNDTGFISGVGVGSGQWHSDWTCRVLRSMSGVLVALNINKGATSYPAMVKWSNFALEPNVVPTDWDYADPASNAGENNLAEFNGDILDGVQLRNRMYLYGTKETWLMELIGGSTMFRFDRAYDRAVINTNCVVEVNGVHFVFGTDDIWIHDGQSDKSLATGRVRKFVYRSLKKELKDHFFATHNSRTNEILFAYVSDDPYCHFPAKGGEGCNRGVIWNYASETFYFVDLPYVSCGAPVRPAVFGISFDAFQGTFTSAGGSFAAQAIETKENLTFGSRAGTFGAKLRTFEPFHESASAFPIDTAANAPAQMVRVGIDADELGAELRGYKLISSVYPQGRLDTDALPITFVFGTYDTVEESPAYGEPQTWDRVNYKLDFNQAGRYLAYTITQEDFRPFSFSGFDFDVTLMGRY